MLIVADTSPLNYLIWIELDWVLPKLYGQIVIPPDVLSELADDDAPAIVRSWTQNRPSWIKILSPNPDGPIRNAELAALGPGERAAIALALQIQPAGVLIDERAGWRIAREFGLPVTGTLGVLDEAAKLRLISLPVALELLTRTSFRYPKQIVARLLEEDAKRK